MIAQCLAVLLSLAAVDGELAHDPLVRTEWWNLLVDAQFGFAQTEQAMFVVRAEDGALRFIRWPKPRALRRAEWKAPVPRGALAIVHTHPNDTPLPSVEDVRTSMRRNMPVYVLTRTRITKATPQGEVLVVVNRDWAA